MSTNEFQEIKKDGEVKDWDEECLYYNELKEKDYEKAFPYIEQSYNNSNTDNAYPEIERIIGANNENQIDREESPYTLYNSDCDSKIKYKVKEVEHSSLYPNNKTTIPQEYFIYLEAENLNLNPKTILSTSY